MDRIKCPNCGVPIPEHFEDPYEQWEWLYQHGLNDLYEPASEDELRQNPYFDKDDDGCGNVTGGHC